MFALGLADMLLLQAHHHQSMSVILMDPISQTFKSSSTLTGAGARPASVSHTYTWANKGIFSGAEGKELDLQGGEVVEDLPLVLDIHPKQAVHQLIEAGCGHLRTHADMSRSQCGSAWAVP